MFLIFKSNKGQTLIEALVALSVAITIIAGIGSAVVGSLNGAIYTRDQTEGTTLAQEGMEFVRQGTASDYKGFTTSYSAVSYCMDGSNSLTAKGTTCADRKVGKFLREVDLYPNDTTDCKNNLKASVNVSWTDSRCKSTDNLYCHEIIVSSCFTDVNSTNVSTNDFSSLNPTSTPIGSTPTPTPTPTPIGATPTPTPTPTPASQGNVYYVATTGNDNNPGTQSQPFATINKANSVVTAGGTVHVSPGVYNQIVTTNTSGSQASRITYVSDTKWGAKIIGDGQATNNGATWNNHASYIDINGFDVSGGYRLGILNYGSFVNVTYNNIHDVSTTFCLSQGGAAIDSAYSTSQQGNQYNSNFINNIASAFKPCSYVHGIYLQSLNEVAQNNIIMNVGGIGIACTHGCNGPTIANNTILNNGYGIRVGWSQSNTTGTTNNAKVTNNIVAFSTNYSIFEYITDRSTSGVGFFNTFRANTLYSNQGSTTCPDCTSTLTSNPLFINYLSNGTGNYHLSASSPSVDKGTAIGVPGIDYDSVIRPQGITYDRGAYER